MAATSWQFSCALASAAKSTCPRGAGATAAAGLDSASATTFSFPAMWRKSAVNSEMKEKCLCCLAVQWSETRCRANVSGL